MKSMFYNLCFGALDDAVSDRVKEEWYIFKNTGRMDKDSHDLPPVGKVISSCSIPPIRNGRHILPENDDVYANLDFDGYQIDQLGNRGDRYDYDAIR